MPSKMPRPDTLRKYYPNSKLSDQQLHDLAEWVKQYLGQNHISPDNKLLKVVIAWEGQKCNQ